MKTEVRRLFSLISTRYDLLNRLLSLGLDQIWRERLMKELSPAPGERVLDLCTGTGDLAKMSEKRGGRVIGVDISLPMLRRAREKVPRAKWVLADAEALPFPPDSFHKVIMGFGLRNLSSPERGLKEALRVLKPGGELGILEFSPNPSRFIRPFYLFYLRKLIPLLGGLISSHREAYSYLSSSVQSFLKPEEVLQTMKSCGFSGVRHLKLTMGIVIIYLGKKEGK